MTPEQLKTALLKRIGKLRACGEPSARPSAEARSKLSKGSMSLPYAQNSSVTVDDFSRELALSISERHELDEVEAYLLLRAFLEGEDVSLDLLSRASRESGKKSRAGSGAPAAGSSKTASAAGSSELRADLLDAFSTFYFEERLYVLRCVAALLRIADDEYHEFHALADSVLVELITPDFGSRCLQGFVALTGRSLPDHIRQNPRHAVFWAQQGLREQLHLLETISLLYYGRLPPTGAFVGDVLDVLRRTDFGRQQANAGFFDSQAAELLQCITHMLSLIAVESLDLERVMDGIELGPLSSDQSDAPDGGASQSLFADPRQVSAGIDYLEDSSEDPLRSPILLAWALVLQRLDVALRDWHAARPGEPLPPRLRGLELETTPDDPAGGPLWQRLASAAFDPSMQLFRTMHAIVTSPVVSASSTSSAVSTSIASSLAHRAIFKGLLLAVTEVVRAPFVPDHEGLLQLWEALFGAGAAPEEGGGSSDGLAALCTQFWQSDFQHEDRRAFLELAARRWPVSFRPLVRLATALTGACGIESLRKPGTAASPSVAQASASVFEFLAELPGVAQVLRAQAGGVSAAFETLDTGDYSTTTYRAKRSIPFLGWRSIPQGTIGRAMSEVDAAPIVVWEATGPISAWRILQDVLASFVGLLTGPASPDGNTSGDDAKVFSGGPANILSFAALAPGEDPSQHGECAADILDLFSATIAGSPETCAALLSHLDSFPRYEGLDLDENAPPVDLVEVTMRIFNQALDARPVASRLVVSSLKLLTLLVPARPSEIFVALRSSNVLTGGVGALPFLSRASTSELDTTGIPPSTLTIHDVAQGSFAGTLALIDLHQALLLEMQRSQFAIPAELLRIKGDVLLRATSWIVEVVWTEFQSWRYVRTREQIELGRRCMRFFESVLRDQSMRAAQVEPTSALERALVTHATPQYLAPLVAVLGTGQQVITQLYRHVRHLEAEAAESLVEASLRLASLIVQRRRQIHAVRPSSQSAHLGLLELLFFDHAVVATRPMLGRRAARIELASAVLAYTLFPYSSSLSSEAARLISAICRSTVEVSAPGLSRNAGPSTGIPTLVGHLGSPAELESTVTGLISLVESDSVDADLRTTLWTMLASIVDSQPTLATLLLTGRHLDSDAEHTLAATKGNAAGDNKEGKKSEPALGRTALQAALDVLDHWDEYWTEAPALLESALRFLDVAWQHALEHRALFATLRSRKDVWKNLFEISTNGVIEPPPRPSRLVEVIDGVLQTDVHDEAASYAFRTMSRARALGIAARDVQLDFLSAKGKDRAQDSAASASLEALIGVLKVSKRLVPILVKVLQFECDPALHSDVESSMSLAFPAVPIDALRIPARLDDFDFSRQPGDSYVYDVELLRRKLEAFIAPTHLDGDGSMTEEGIDDLGVQQASVLLAGLNLDWTAIDAQAALLRAWRSLLETALGRIGASVHGTPGAQELRQSCLDAWIHGAMITADETRSGDVMRGIHAERLRLLTVLLEAAWGSSTDATPALGKTNAAVGSSKDVQAVVNLAQRILTHEGFSLEDSVRETRAPRFHGELFRIILLCGRRSRVMLKSGAGASNAPRPRNSEAHSVLHAAVDSFASHAIMALRLLVDKALLASATPATVTLRALNELEEDLTLVSSVLELLLRSDLGLQPHFWSARFQTTGLLPACVDLLSRAPLASDVAALRDSDSPLATPATSRPLFVSSILSLFFALASNVSAAEQLILAGVMTGLSSNALTTALETGATRPTLPAGGVNPGHACWVLILQIVAALVQSLTSPDRLSRGAVAANRTFVEVEVQGFVRVYGAQVLAALSFAPLDSSQRDFGWRERSQAEGPSISSPQLSELVVLTQLFYCMAQSADLTGQRSSRSRGSDASGTARILNTLAKRTTSLLQQIVYLLQRPRELASLISGASSGDDASSRVPEAEAALFKREEEQVTEQMRQIAHTAVAALCTWSGALDVLIDDADDWPMDKVLVAPVSCSALSRFYAVAHMRLPQTIRTAPTAPTSIGTLLDLSTYFCDEVRAPSATQERRLASAAALEQTLLFAAAQLAMRMRGESRELEVGLVRDLSSAVDSGKAAAASAAASEEGSILHAVRGFVQRIAT
jgi:nuclear pore complex protein Nup188